MQDRPLLLTFTNKEFGPTGKEYGILDLLIQNRIVSYKIRHRFSPYRAYMKMHISILFILLIESIVTINGGTYYILEPKYLSKLIIGQFALIGYPHSPRASPLEFRYQQQSPIYPPGHLVNLILQLLAFLHFLVFRVELLRLLSIGEDPRSLLLLDRLLLVFTPIVIFEVIVSHQVMT